MPNPKFPEPFRALVPDPKNPDKLRIDELAEDLERQCADPKLEIVLTPEERRAVLTERQEVDVETLANWLGITSRRLQQLAAEGKVCGPVAHGRWRLRATVRSYEAIVEKNTDPLLQLRARDFAWGLPADGKLPKNRKKHS
ncbi:MAG: hypothetical protein JSR82_22525 [Verrucomicrobia bacterium]|nr:hypothetical protein [Verrucomicrobiota bacterium]